ncbi:MAG: hypothetical protein SFY66_00695 [Oculatellaceae cyanobacterium bins.114]|nr:hypothetical protein [Oculatellaceae cyanobacterium bins.114]
MTISDDDTPSSPSTYNIPGSPNTPETPSNPVTRMGNARSDRLLGTSVNEVLVGLRGNDTVQGDVGADTLIGVDPNTRKPGVCERDVLMGNEGANVFVLGNAQSVFYNDGNRATVGLQDYALIKDFNASSDRIQLHGRRSNYHLGAAPQGTPKGIGIFLENGRTDELIAIAQGQRNLRLTNSTFQFV